MKFEWHLFIATALATLFPVDSSILKYFRNSIKPIENNYPLNNVLTSYNQGYTNQNPANNQYLAQGYPVASGQTYANGQTYVNGQLSTNGQQSYTNGQQAYSNGQTYYNNNGVLTPNGYQNSPYPVASVFTNGYNNGQGAYANGQVVGGGLANGQLYTSGQIQSNLG